MESSAPPLGLIPRYVWQEKARKSRIDEILGVMIRYAVAGMPAKEEWVRELAELVTVERDAK